VTRRGLSGSILFTGEKGGVTGRGLSGSILFTGERGGDGERVVRLYTILLVLGIKVVTYKVRKYSDEGESRYFIWFGELLTWKFQGHTRRYSLLPPNDALLKKYVKFPDGR
jgi:hypothetical protein